MREASAEGIRLSGIGDEAGSTILEQIRALELVGWRTIELRTVDGIPLADLSDRHFDRVAEALSDARMSAVCLDSRIANWGRPITGDLEADLTELRTLARRCGQLGTRYVRIMSYPNDGLDDADWRDEALRRLRILAAEAEQSGVVLLHENCAGWAGRDGSRMLQMLETVGGPALRLLFDMGNGVEYEYDGYDLLRQIVDHVAHVHVKDARGPASAAVYTLPGDGECRVADCLRLLVARGYSGVWSVEPHLRVRPHEGLAGAGHERLGPFVTYARRLEELIRDEVTRPVGGAPR